MTNEKMALMIQQGNNKYYSDLWENCRKLMYKILRSKLLRLRLPNYITPEDMEQELYFALCRAVAAYDNKKQYSFNSYLNYSVMRTIRDCFPSKGNTKIALNESSYNELVGDDENTELIELIADEGAEASYYGIELTDEQKAVRESLANLPENERKVTYLHYFKDMTYNQIAQKLSLPEYETMKHGRKALNMLRKDKKLRVFYDEYVEHYYYYCSHDCYITVL